MKKLEAVFLTMLLVVSLTACSGETSGETSGDTPEEPQGEQTVYEMKWATNAAEVEGDPETMYSQVLCNYINEHSDGRIQCTIYWNGVLGGLTELTQQSMSGSIAGFITNSASLESYDQKAMIFNIPGLYSSMDQLNAFLDSDYTQQFYAELGETMNLRLIGQTCNGFRNFQTVNRPLYTPEDARGLNIRVMDSPVSIEMIKAIGANPTVIAAGDVYTGLQNGVIDGQENVLPWVISNKIYEQQKYLMLDMHMASFVLAAVSEEWLETLPEDLQQVVLDGVMEGWKTARENFGPYYYDSIEWLGSEGGMEIIEYDDETLAQWHDLMSAAARRYVEEQVGTELVQSIFDEVKKY